MPILARHRPVTDLVLGGLSVALAFAASAADPGTVRARVVGGLLLGFWAAAAFRVGRLSARGVDPGDDGPRALLRSVAHAHLFVLAEVFLLAAVGLLGTVPLGVLHAAAFVVAGRANPPRLPGISLREAAGLFRRAPAPALFVLMVAGIAAGNAAWGFLAPEGRIDDLTYHLVFPAEWLQDGTLSTKEVPFGNHSPSYHPKDTEAVFAWAMAPLRETLPVAALQLLWLGAAGLALYDVFRRIGAPPRAAAVAAALFPIGPVVADQLLCGYVDLAFGLFFVLSLRAALELRARPRTGTWLELCAFAGVFAGTKMLGLPLTALVLAPSVLLLSFPHLRRLPAPGRLVASAAGGGALFLAFGGWWYVRNWMMTGNPVFPLIVQVGGRVLFDGAYAGEAMPGSRLASLLGLAPEPVRWLLAAGATVTLAAVVRRLFGRATAAPAGRGPDPRLAAFVGVVLPAVLAWLFARSIPLDEERFLLITAGLAGGALLVPLSLPRAGRASEWIALAVLVVCLLQPATRDALVMPIEPRKLLVASGTVWWSFALAVLVFLGGAALAAVRLPPRGVPVAAVAWTAAALVALQAAGNTADPDGPAAHRHVKQLWVGRSAVRELGRGLRIAATGKPATLPLYGDDLGNRVRYVNVNDTPGGLFHDHVLRWPELRGELREDRRGVGYYRKNPSYEAWRKNLAAFGADVLVVFPLPDHAREGAYIRDREGFPIEATWANEHPDVFRPVTRNREIRIYDLR